jgi:putative ABC transport system permease protein
MSAPPVALPKNSSRGAVLRLVVSELKVNWKPWIGVLAIAVVSTACMVLALATVFAGDGAGSRVKDAYNQLGSSVTMFVALAAVVAISITAAVCVRVQRFHVAVWMIAGVQPRQAGRIVEGEVLATSFVGGLVGLVVGYAAWPAYGSLVTGSGLPPTPGLDALPSGQSGLWALLITVVTGLWGGRKAAKQARGVEPIAILRQDDEVGNRFGWGKISLLALLAMSLVGCYVAVVFMKGSSQATVESGLVVYLMTGLLWVGIVGVLGPTLLGPVLTLWTSLVPRRASMAWYLARNRCRDDLDFSSAIVTPLIVAGGSVGALYGWVAQMRNASSALGQAFTGNGLPITDVVLSVGGPVLISAVATAGILFATSADKEQEAVLLSVAGASSRTMRLKALCEAVIFSVTAALVMEGILALNGAVFAFVLDLGPVPGAGFAGVPLEPLVVTGCGFVLILASTLLTLRSADRQDTVAVLSAE